MAVHRANRVAEAIKKEVAQMLRDELKDPRIGFVTVTSVEVTADLRHAKIFFSLYGSEEDRKQCLKALSSAQGFVRSELGKRLRLRYTPEIIFKFDESIQHGARIMELLEEVHSSQGEKTDE